MTHLYLVRHGESFANLEPILAGPKGDKGLTPRGQQQAERLRERLMSGEIPIDVLIASDLPRAVQTAQTIAPALGLEVQIDPSVREVEVGVADGLHAAEAAARYGLVDFVYDPLRPIAPEGESYATFTLRVSTALSRITKQYEGQRIMIVTHGGLIEAAFVHFMNLSSLRMPPVDFMTHNTSLTHWIYAERDGRYAWKLERYNDIGHLAGIALSDPPRWRDAAIGPQAGSHLAAPAPTEDYPDELEQSQR